MTNLKSLTEQQRSAVLDLLVLGIYSDAHIATVEDAAVHQLLGELGLDAASDRNREIDASVTRVRKHVASTESAQKYATSLAGLLQAKDQRRQVQIRLQNLLNSDGKLTATEKNFAAVVDAALRL